MLLAHAQSPLQSFLSDFKAGQMQGWDETDLRKNLFSRIYGQFHTLGIRFQTSKASLGIEYYTENPEISINPVKTDYPPSEKFDLVILNTEAENPAVGGYSAIWEQPLALALRLRTCVDPTFLPRYLKQSESDLTKFADFRNQHGQSHLQGAVSIILLSYELEEIPQGFKSENPALSTGSQIWLVDKNKVWVSAE